MTFAPISWRDLPNLSKNQENQQLKTLYAKTYTDGKNTYG